MSVEDIDNIKHKYWAKTLSKNAVEITLRRLIDTYPLFGQIVWLNISAFDLSQLGIGLLNNIAPATMEPFNIDRKIELPLIQEILQGIWLKAEPIDMSQLYPWLTDLREFIKENIAEEYKTPMLIGIGVKGFYGITPYERSIYDPVIAREFLRATAFRLRLQKTSDKLYIFILDQLKDYLEMTGATTDIIYNRIMLLMTAQTSTFILGLSVLGTSWLTHAENKLTQVTFTDAKGNTVTAKIGTLDHLQFGFILGLSPLGYGLLLPKTTVYKMPEGTKNPPIVNVIANKIIGMRNRYLLTAFMFANYNKPDEALDYHTSERTMTYANWHIIRRQVEEWVLNKIKDQPTTPVQARQYINAILQLISWRAKRHKWGYKLFQTMTEEQFYYWWIQYWTSQGLNKATLEALYEGIRTWLPILRQMKLHLGEKVKQSRLRLAIHQ